MAFLILLFLLISFNLHTAYAQSTTFPRLEPDPKALDYFNQGRRNNGYSWIELAEISLWTSGDSSAANLEKIRAAAEALNNSAELPVSAKEKAEFILSFLHRNILRSYSIYQTRVDTIFTNGRYNCVSSAVLYMIFCESAGIKTSGVITKDHALVTVHIDGEDIDVETTNRYGFDPGNRKDFHDQFGRLTGFTYVPAHNYRDRQTIGKIELVSLILNNRISDLERQNRYADSVPLAIDRAALLVGNALAVTQEAYSSESLFTDPRKELMDRLHNYGAWLLRANREEDALRWADAAYSKYPDPNRWQDFIFAAVNNRIARFIRENKVADARNFLESQKAVLTAANYTQLDIVVLDAELLRSANQIRTAGEGNAALTAIAQARDSGKIDERRAAELTTFAIQKTASVLSAAPARDWRAAIRFIEASLERFGGNREAEQALRTYRNNLAVDYHNRFAAEWNKRNYEEAERILIEGLAEIPNDRQLLVDMETVNKNRAR
ncbi:MAG: hypothetical protein LBQ93_05890 [Treponema sp.]|jgi:hypothetical protein|nr:hypothetical protein [Treponema sp.]